MSENETQTAADEKAIEVTTEVAKTAKAEVETAPAADMAETPAAGDAVEEVTATETPAEEVAAPEAPNEAAVEEVTAPEAPKEEVIEEEPAEPEEISYHAVEKEGEITAIWEMQGQKHLRTIDPRSTEGQKIFALFTSDIHETDSPSLSSQATT